MNIQKSDKNCCGEEFQVVNCLIKSLYKYQHFVKNGSKSTSFL